MSESVKGASRPYDSPVRRRRAEATRSEVLKAALELMLEAGYGATSIDAIAARASVSPETIYATFGSKRALLMRLVDVTLAGDEQPVAILERDWVRQLAGEHNPDRAVRLLARNGRLILERVAPVYEVLRGAAASDAHAAEVLERYRTQRRAAQRELVALLARNHQLRTGLAPAAAADVVFAIGSPETYGLLVRDRGWTPARFERWYADALRRLILR